MLTLCEAHKTTNHYHKRPDASSFFKPCDVDLVLSSRIRFFQCLRRRVDSGSFPPDDTGTPNMLDSKQLYWKQRKWNRRRM